jgi:RHS repeat-associated protein
MLLANPITHTLTQNLRGLPPLERDAGVVQDLYGYDANGNLTQRGTQGFVFDIGNRLTSAPGKASYAYDGHGRRTAAWHADGSSRLQAYSQAGQLLYASHSTQGVTRYVYLGPKLIAEVNSLTGTGFSHTDALGSPVARTSAGASPTILSRTRYEPYGATAAGTNPNGIGFTGHVNDVDTGLVYMQQRYYEPIAGRFLSVDPVVTDAKTGGHFNRYVYAENNPYTLKDPDGRAPIAVPMLLGAISGAIGAMRDPNAGVGKIALGAIGGAAAGAVGTLAVVGKTLGVSIGQAALAGGMGNVVGQIIGDPSKPPSAAQAATQAAISAVGGVAGHGAAAAVRGASTTAETASVASTVSTAVSTVGNAAVPQNLGGMAANKPAAAPTTPSKPDEKLSN